MNFDLATAHLEQISASNASILLLADRIIGTCLEPDTQHIASQIKTYCEHIQDDVDFSFAIFTPPRNSAVN